MDEIYRFALGNKINHVHTDLPNNNKHILRKLGFTIMHMIFYLKLSWI